MTVACEASACRAPHYVDVYRAELGLDRGLQCSNSQLEIFFEVRFATAGMGSPSTALRAGFRLRSAPPPSAQEHRIKRGFLSLPSTRALQSKTSSPQRPLRRSFNRKVR